MGHPVQRRNPGRRCWPVVGGRITCRACEAAVHSSTARWRCVSGCDYSVCEGCYQQAAQCAALRGSGLCLSDDASTTEGSVFSEGSSLGDPLLAGALELEPESAA